MVGLWIGCFAFLLVSRLFQGQQAIIIYKSLWIFLRKFFTFLPYILVPQLQFSHIPRPLPTPTSLNTLCLYNSNNVHLAPQRPTTNAISDALA